MSRGRVVGLMVHAVFCTPILAMETAFIIAPKEILVARQSLPKGKGRGSRRQQVWERAALLRQTDTDGDGVLTAEELAGRLLPLASVAFKQKIRLLDESSDGVLDASELTGGNVSSAAFEFFDHNKDAWISPHELKQRLWAELVMHAKSFLHKYDRNSDDVISEKELSVIGLRDAFQKLELQGLASVGTPISELVGRYFDSKDWHTEHGHIPAHLSALAASHFALADADNSGDLDEREIQKLLREERRESMEQVKAMAREADAADSDGGNSDGFVDKMGKTELVLWIRVLSLMM
jgi:Ca2+-binding EF-hand superfamily protein